ncbi:receptor kinase-like protein Xa21 [Cornus florida]|uniref:receptor kinase-like protein Xa21 n=1 Tax=Cornus florida TaxID=4283 RepID=UPI002899FC47|nr:receptor kinase-like protein Xa21 [Cornus florida]
MGSIPREIGFLHSLQILDIGNNFISGVIPSTIFNIFSLRAILLNNNSLDGTLPMEMCNNRLKLQVLDLSRNQLSGQLPTSLHKCTQLQALWMSINDFTGSMPMGISNLTKLKELALCRNKMTGKIPPSVVNMSNLEGIDIGDNNIHGSIPQELGQLLNLIFLSTAINNLGGAPPHSIFNISTLETLSLSRNHFFGNLPSTIGLWLPNLKYFYLPENRFSGPIPCPISNASKLTDIHLNENFFNGSLPMTLGNLQHLQDLRLPFNNLTNDQSVPEIDFLSSLTNCKLLKVLVIEGNPLNGILPKFWGNLSISLQQFYADSSGIRGMIPSEIGNLSNLVLLELGGEIPTGGPFANFTPESFSQNDALCGAPQFHVKACKSHRKSGRIQIVLKLIVPSVVSLVLVGVALLIWWLQFRNKNKQIPIQVDPPISITHRRISYHEILYATNHFSEGNLIGKGSIGTVYKGTFSDGMIAAVKVFDLELQRAFTSFDAECEVIRNIRHRNLVKIISSCSNLDFKALVLEYMPKGNLENWLYSHNYFLNIVERLGIMIDVASALEYLHRGSSTSVVHCDLKPSNILLDEDMVAHVTDFGIAKLLVENKSITHTKTLGTIGYMAPEYGSAGIVSIVGDVYSYGILQLKTFTRKKPTDDLFVGEVSLKSWVSESFPSAVMDVVDANLVSGEEENFTALQKILPSIFKLALECTSQLPEERINMDDALVRLKKFKTIVLENLMGS